MKLQIVTPDSKTFDGEVDGVVYQAPHGEIGILPNHAPYFSLIKPGELIIDQKGVKKALAVGSGFVEVVNTGVIVLTDMAFHSNEINEDKMNDAIKRAQEALKNTKVTDEEKEKHLEMIEKSLAILRVKQKKM
jgi:F-type H+-transporting ATPase subunit epsilon